MMNGGKAHLGKNDAAPNADTDAHSHYLVYLSQRQGRNP